MELPTRKQTPAQTNKKQKRFTKYVPRKCYLLKNQTSKNAFSKNETDAKIRHGQVENLYSS